MNDELTGLIHRILFEASTIKLLTDDRQLTNVADRILKLGEEIFTTQNA